MRCETDTTFLLYLARQLYLLSNTTLFLCLLSNTTRQQEGSNHGPTVGGIRTRPRVGFELTLAGFWGKPNKLHQIRANESFLTLCSVLARAHTREQSGMVQWFGGVVSCIRRRQNTTQPVVFSCIRRRQNTTQSVVFFAAHRGRCRVRIPAANVRLRWSSFGARECHSNGNTSRHVWQETQRLCQGWKPNWTTSPV